MPELYQSPSIAVLFSGGMDSAVLISDLAQRYRSVVPIYIRQGLAWEDIEVYWARRYLHALRNKRVKPLQVFSLPLQDVYGRHWSVQGKRVPGFRSEDAAVYLPGRNLILGVKAAVFCALHKIPRMAWGTLGGNPFPDAAPGFFKQWAKTLQRGLHARLSIETPYRRLSKEDVLRRGKDLPLSLTFSCLAPVGRRHCGRCNKCAERQKSFRQAGVIDKTVYARGRS